MARVKTMIAELTRGIEDSRCICDAWCTCVPPEGQRRIEEDRRRVEEWNAKTRKRMQEERMKLKWGIVACFQYLTM